MKFRSDFDPIMSCHGDVVAKRYMGWLNKLGHLVMAVAGSKLVYFVVTPLMAIAVSLIVLAFAFFLGWEYRHYDKEFIKRTKPWALLKVMSRAWQFWVAMCFFMSLGIGTVQWVEIEFWATLLSWIGVAGLVFEFALKSILHS